MWCCVCKEKIKPKHDSIIECVKQSFEGGSIRVICILQHEGKVLSMFNRDDISSIETDSILQKVAVIKTQTLKLSTLQGEICRSLHIQGKHTCCSMYDLPDNTLLVFVMDCNPITADLALIYETRAYMHARIGELFVKP